jgi:hypothetical protein
MLMAREFRESSRIPRIGRGHGYFRKIRECNDAARCLSLLAQNDKAGDRIDTAAQMSAATDGSSFAAHK